MWDYTNIMVLTYILTIMFNQVNLSYKLVRDQRELPWKSRKMQQMAYIQRGILQQRYAKISRKAIFFLEISYVHIEIKEFL